MEWNQASLVWYELSCNEIGVIVSEAQFPLWAHLVESHVLAPVQLERNGGEDVLYISVEVQPAEPRTSCWKEGLRDEWHLDWGVWAGHCGDEWHLTGPLWRILPVYPELLLIGCLKSNFLLHVPVRWLPAWMSAWLAVAYTHIARHTYTHRGAMSQGSVRVGRNKSFLSSSEEPNRIFQGNSDVILVFWCATVTFSMSARFHISQPTIKLFSICHI